jgi:hypothetical protein
MGRGPASFQFDGNKALVLADDHEIEKMASYADQYVQMANRGLLHELNQAAKRAEAEQREKLRRETEEAERRARILEKLKSL